MSDNNLCEMGCPYYLNDCKGCLIRHDPEAIGMVVDGSSEQPQQECEQAFTSTESKVLDILYRWINSEQNRVAGSVMEEIEEEVDYRKIIALFNQPKPLSVTGVLTHSHHGNHLYIDGLGIYSALVRAGLHKLYGQWVKLTIEGGSE